ncbi:MAG: NAD(P)-dependent oxidoreductase [Leptolyngbya sp. PLA2]|nr:NAD(P)-dependent oxidoreductase [Leptolyngbya sp.]MCE7971931.1 NAD(P)-dependent oxidoreductase [Leptolyngbya sp. PL-A2]MCQ3939705.1 hypothetical protein [cyanobacterium CYA1]MDL1903962.1 NAD(P)-dependent oxidoreductase [Synechococcales cyanobacterium CNB]GIK18725.1 MAG: N-acetyl-alpha-D-glucosaminyl-diphospho-ditrans, octacis-undecaprenol 4-epimerase [Planctomycetota bacterium]
MVVGAVVGVSGAWRGSGGVKVLVTGGSGFIGSFFIDHFRRTGTPYVIMDLVDPPFDTSGGSFIKGDIRDPAAVRRAMVGCDRVLHLAAAHHDFGIARDTYFSVNEIGSKVMCEELDRAGVRECCFYSTVAVYGDAPEPHFEDSEKRPNSPYGESKLAGERVFEAWTARGEGRRCLVIRPTVTFGPRNFANMYSLIRQAASGRYLEFGAGTNVKSLSYIENIVDATLYLWGRAAGARAPFEVFNYIDKPDLTSAEITAAVCHSLGRKRPPRLPLWVGLALALPFDAVIALTGRNLPISGARVRKLFSTQTKFEADKVIAAGFKARVPLREGIDRMVKWYLAEGRAQQAVWHVPPAEVVIGTAEA